MVKLGFGDLRPLLFLLGKLEMLLGFRLLFLDFRSQRLDLATGALKLFGLARPGGGLGLLFELDGGAAQGSERQDMLPKMQTPEAFLRCEATQLGHNRGRVALHKIPEPKRMVVGIGCRVETRQVGADSSVIARAQLPKRVRQAVSETRRHDEDVCKADGRARQHLDVDQRSVRIVGPLVSRGDEDWKATRRDLEKIDQLRKLVLGTDLPRRVTKGNAVSGKTRITCDLPQESRHRGVELGLLLRRGHQEAKAQVRSLPLFPADCHLGRPNPPGDPLVRIVAAQSPQLRCLGRKSHAERGPSGSDVIKGFSLPRAFGEISATVLLCPRKNGPARGLSSRILVFPLDGGRYAEHLPLADWRTELGA